MSGRLTQLKTSLVKTFFPCTAPELVASPAIQRRPRVEKPADPRLATVALPVLAPRSRQRSPSSPENPRGRPSNFGAACTASSSSKGRGQRSGGENTTNHGSKQPPRAGQQRWPSHWHTCVSLPPSHRRPVEHQVASNTSSERLPEIDAPSLGASRRPPPTFWRSAAHAAKPVAAATRLTRPRLRSLRRLRRSATHTDLSMRGNMFLQQAHKLTWVAPTLFFGKPPKLTLGPSLNPPRRGRPERPLLPAAQPQRHDRHSAPWPPARLRLLDLVSRVPTRCVCPPNVQPSLTSRCVGPRRTSRVSEDRPPTQRPPQRPQRRTHHPDHAPTAHHHKHKLLQARDVAADSVDHEGPLAGVALVRQSVSNEGVLRGMPLPRCTPNGSAQEALRIADGLPLDARLHDRGRRSRTSGRKSGTQGARLIT